MKKGILIVDFEGDIKDYVVDIYRRDDEGVLKEYKFDEILKPLPQGESDLIQRIYEDGETE